MTFGKRLTQLREEKGYNTRKKFAEKLSLPETTLRNYETDVREPGHTFLKQMSDFFNVSTDYLLGLTEEREKFSSHQLKSSEVEHIEKYRFISTHSPDGASVVDMILDREYSIAVKLKEQTEQLLQTNIAASEEITPKRLWAYYGKIAAAGTSVEFSDMIAGTKEYPVTKMNENADYVIGINGDSMEPEYFDGDIVFVDKNAHVNIGDIGIFQKDNNIYIKKAGEHGLVSLKEGYPIITSEDGIRVLGKVLGKAEV